VAGTETNVPAGTVTPLENVNGRNARRLTATGKRGRVNQHLVFGMVGKESDEREAIPSSR
jgi:hypothetical protein